VNFEVHYEKYKKFKDSAEQDRYIPSRIEDYFKSAFHLIEAVVIKKLGLHIQKHQKVRTVLKQNPDIFEDKTDEIINEFHEIENKIRVATGYGKRHNGELLEKTQESFNKVEDICLDKLK
jgi:hypothetical protein